MMAFLILLVIASLTLFLLKVSNKLNRMALELAAIAVLIGVAGYVWQGSPNLPSSLAEQAAD